MNAASFTKSGSKSAAVVKLDKKVFGLEVVSHELMKQAYLAQLASSRPNIAQTKKRGQVSGGGQKPWRQKGTGRARFGSSRNPIWRGGGVAFGPTGQENYTKKLNQKSRKLAISQALSLAAKEGRVKVIEDFKPADGKTAAAAKLLNKIGHNDKLTLVITTDADNHSWRSVNNLPTVKMVDQAYLKLNDTLDAEQLIFTKDALAKLTERLGK